MNEQEDSVWLRLEAPHRRRGSDAGGPPQNETRGPFAFGPLQ
jgi:hypothetical protein